MVLGNTLPAKKKSCSELWDNELQIKGQKKEIKAGVKLHDIKHYQKGKAEERDVRKERVKTKRKPAHSCLSNALHQ